MATVIAIGPKHIRLSLARIKPLIDVARSNHNYVTTVILGVYDEAVAEAALAICMVFPGSAGLVSPGPSVCGQRAQALVHEVISTSVKSCGETIAASFAPHFRTHTRVLNIKPHMIATLLEIMPGQVLQAIPVLLRMSAEPRRSSMDSGNR